MPPGAWPKQQGIKIQNRIAENSGWNVVTLPILHDSSDNARELPGVAPHSDNRRIIYTDGKAVQVKAGTPITGHSIAETKAMITFYRTRCGIAGSPAVGLVDMTKYSAWIKKFGIDITLQQLAATHICQ